MRFFFISSSLVSSTPLVLTFFFTVVASFARVLALDARHALIARKIAPARRNTFNERRGVVDTSPFAPQSSVVLDYGHGSYNSPTATVSFNASHGIPIIVLETFDDLLNSVQCSKMAANPTTMIDLYFSSEDAVLAASNAWAVFETLHVVTSHASCNLNDERGAWRVHAMQTGNQNQAIRLFAEQISLNRLGSYHVSFAQHGLAGGWGAASQTLERRVDLNSSINPTYQNDLSGQEIFPGNISSMVTQEIMNAIQASELVVDCIECTSEFNFTVNLDFSVDLDLNITAASVTTVINSFNQSILLGVSIAEDLSLNPSYDLITVDLSPLAVPGLFNIGPQVGISVDFDFDMSAGVNFTFGAKGSIDSGTSASVDFFNQQIVNATGWDNANIEGIPIRVNGGSLNMSIAASLGPFFAIGITAGGASNGSSAGIEARITQNAPTINLDVDLTANVNRNCDPVGANDFESFAAAYLLGADMSFDTVASLTVDLGSLLGGLHDWSTSFPHKDIPIYTNSGASGDARPCFVIVADLSDSTPDATTGPSAAIMTPAPSGTLLQAASAVPTFDVPGIESYYSANGHLPTGVNYSQLAQATTVPASLQTPVQQAAQSQAAAAKNGATKVKSTDAFIIFCVVVTGFMFAN